MPSTSARSHALTNASTSSRRPSSPSASSSAACETSGIRSSTVARARWSALLTDAVVVSSIEAVSAAEKPSTSRRISTARWVPGRCCSAATNASSTLSRRW